ncbi:MAG: AAA domain-containing protein, partial [bacterium]
PLDDMAGRLVEEAAAYARSGQAPLAECVLRALLSEVPEVEGDLLKVPRADTFPVQPSPWVLIAPTSSFWAFTRHLMGDYERLEGLLQEDPGQTGGLRLLEDQPDPSNVASVDVLPLLPLNPSQERAVTRTLEQRPLTVISGPPGTGKSQVVVAVLLNAWASGRTVLFASNNNKAVDVVREWVERFESEFPIVVRAGAKAVQNIQEVLRRTLNMAGVAAHGAAAATQAAELRKRRGTLVRERGQPQEALASGLPQRIDEAKATALRGNGEYRSRLAGLTEREAALKKEQGKLGFSSFFAEAVADALAATQAWLARIEHYEDLVRRDNLGRGELQRRILEHERQRNRAEVLDEALDLVSRRPGILADVTPEEIDTSDRATLVWEIKVKTARKQ